MADHSPQEQIQEFKDLVIAYFKQETVEPIKGLARYVGYGLAGALLMGVGVCFLAVGALRALQTQTGKAFDGNWTWAPYGITIVALVAVAALVWLARSPRSSR